MAIEPDHDGQYVIHTREINKSADHVTPKSYQHVYAIERNGYLDPPWEDWDQGRLMNRVDRIGSSGSYVTKLFFIMDDNHTSVHNKALDKLMSQLDICENLFESWYERRQAYQMLFDAGKEVFSFLRGWRNPRYWAGKKGLVRPSTLPEAWLSWNFGIKPLVSTIDNCLNGLGQPLTSATFSGSSRKQILAPLDWDTIWSRSDYVYKIGCTVRPNPNPNAALLNIGGITTPFSTAWSVIPWGWAVDYFLNVSQLLSNFEVRHPGVIIEHGYTTRFIKGTWFGGHPQKYNGRPWYVVDGSYFIMDRKPSINLNYKPELKFPTLGSNSLANLFSAIALTMKGK